MLTASPFRGNDKPKKNEKLLKATDINVTIRIQKVMLETRVVKDQIVNRTLQLLTDMFQIHKFSIAFPEFVFPISVQLKQFLKTCKNTLWRQATKQLLKNAEKWTETVRQRRSEVTFGPGDVDAVSAFMKDQKLESRRARIMDPLLGRELRKRHENENNARSNNIKRKRQSEKEDESKKKKQKKKKKKKTQKVEKKTILHTDVSINAPDEVGDLDDWSDDDE